MLPNNRRKKRLPVEGRKNSWIQVTHYKITSIPYYRKRTLNQRKVYLAQIRGGWKLQNNSALQTQITSRRKIVVDFWGKLLYSVRTIFSSLQNEMKVFLFLQYKNYQIYTHVINEAFSHAVLPKLLNILQIKKVYIFCIGCQIFSFSK